MQPLARRDVLKNMLLPSKSGAAFDEEKKEPAAGSSSMAYSLPQSPPRPQHIYTPTSAASAPLQDESYHKSQNLVRHTPNTASSLGSLQSAQTLTTSGSNNLNTSRSSRPDHSFHIDQPLSPKAQHTPLFPSAKNPPGKRDRLGTFESVMAVRSLGSGHRHGQMHSNLAQQMLGSIAAVERRDAVSSPNDDGTSDVSSLSDDGTSSGGAAGRIIKKSLLRRRRSKPKKSRSRPGSIGGRQTSDQAPSIATSITSVTHTMETIDCSFPSPLTAEINVEKVKSSRDLMGNHRRSQSSMSGTNLPLINRSAMIHDSWTSPTPGYGDTLSMKPRKGEDLIDVSSNTPIDPFSGLIGMPSSTISMCDNSFASGTTSSMEKPKASTFLRKPASIGRSKSANTEFDPFAAVKSDIPRAPRYLRDNPLLSKSKYRGQQLSSPLQHKRAPSLDTACMIGSIAMSETSAPVVALADSDSIVSNLPPLPAQAPSSVAEEPDEDDDSSYASFTEELKRKDWGKTFVGDVMNSVVDKFLPVVGLKPKEAKLKRAGGCLT